MSKLLEFGALGQQSLVLREARRGWRAQNVCQKRRGRVGMGGDVLSSVLLDSRAWCWGGRGEGDGRQRESC